MVAPAASVYPQRGNDAYFCTTLHALARWTLPFCIHQLSEHING
jgi:hypothetical protein